MLPGPSADPTNAACEAAKEKLKKAKDKLKKLRADEDAKPKAVKRAKAKVKARKQKVKQACCVSDVLTESCVIGAHSTQETCAIRS